MTEMTVAMPLSGDDVVDAIFGHIRQMVTGDCHLNPALAYEAFEAEITIKLKLIDNGREPEVEIETRTRGGSPLGLKEISAAEAFRQLHKLPPNVVRQNAGLPIPTLVEDSSGKKEVKNVKYDRMSASGTTPQDPGKQPGQQPGEKNPHPPGSPEHEKHEKERKEKEEREKKERERR